MEITGRVTADAVVNKVNSDKEVVNFSIAINDSYKPKRSTEVREVTTYINCSYWLNSKTAQWLKKGAIVQLFGRISLNVYSSTEGKAMGSLTFHINSLKFLVFAKSANSSDIDHIFSGRRLRGRTICHPDEEKENYFLHYLYFFVYTINLALKICI
ncbi:single-stranded DNA-binding protein [Flavobacterium gawalongense]|uniref:Single-stranded DNA-binding protein n=1 Tax=Flavobacterium gawalongense TaxID=2594432 RepID=A0A553BSM8_9FLAO|nr:single-stranded DNA-binding protein [Flavobacterium gawalongense]TRX11260.1 single-stranded DNA-binding protein [Flavobacterium gawalongense]TRX12279.1 single-stranded DNA-binding protein [Flavobacterium gawalongense]TRX30182.1 single-stranded DNA-binding protein [Flavobacterium gawalongense]